MILLTMAHVTVRGAFPAPSDYLPGDLFRNLKPFLPCRTGSFGEDMATLQKSIIILKPQDKVWRRLADFGEIERWSPNVKKSRLTKRLKKRNTVEVGTSRTIDHVSDNTVTHVITKWDVGRSFTFALQGDFGPMKRMEESWSLKPSGDGTLVTVTLTYKVKVPIIGALMDRFMFTSLMNTEITVALAGLKHNLETGQNVGTEFEDLPTRSVK